MTKVLYNKSDYISHIAEAIKISCRVKVTKVLHNRGNYDLINEKPIERQSDNKDSVERSKTF